MVQLQMAQPRGLLLPALLGVRWEHVVTLSLGLGLSRSVGGGARPSPGLRSWSFGLSVTVSHMLPGNH